MYIVPLSLALLAFEQRGIGIKPLPPVVMPAASGAAPVTLSAADEAALKSAQIGTDGPGLVEFFKKRTPPAPDKAKIADLLKQLADKTASTRDKAFGELVCLGPAAVPQLRQASNNFDDLDTAARAKQVLQLIEGEKGAAVVMNVIRRLAETKPDGAVAALIAYIPFADNDDVQAEVEAALATVGFKDGKPDAALLKAIEDKVPVRRAAAADVLVRVGGASQYPAIRPLLKDEKPTVKLRAALSLASSNDGEAIPVLIDLLADLPSAQRKQAEEFLTELAGDWAVVAPKGNDAVARRLRRDVWAGWWKSLDGKTLLDEFKSRTLSDADHAKVTDLVKKLGDESAEAREKASAELVGMGTSVTPLLRQAIAAGNPKVLPFATKCLQLIEKDNPTPLPSAAIKLIALKRPDGALETLLAYLPCAEDPGVVNEVRDVIAFIGVGKDDKPDPILVKALEEKVGVRRGVAAEALCRIGGVDMASIKKLLADPEAIVRYKTAFALINQQEKEAVNVLIKLLGEVSPEQGWEIEDYLARLAGDKTPTSSLMDEAGRKKAVEDWGKWWKDNGEKTTLVRHEEKERLLGYTVVVESYDQFRRQGGRIIEYDASGKERWKITQLQYPQDAKILPGERVLITEQGFNRVTERDKSGKILWEKQSNQPFWAQRLRNGNTFIACRNQIIEVDKSGKEVLNHPKFNDTILCCDRYRDGTIAYLTYSGNFVKLDAKGKEIKNTRVPINMNFGLSGGAILPNDRMLVSIPNMNKVQEWDAEGKMHWEASVPFPGVPTRLQNGNTLVPANNNVKLVEIDRGGKQVWESKDTTLRPWRGFRR